MLTDSENGSVKLKPKFPSIKNYLCRLVEDHAIMGSAYTLGEISETLGDFPVFQPSNSLLTASTSSATLHTSWMGFILSPHHPCDAVIGFLQNRQRIQSVSFGSYSTWRWEGDPSFHSSTTS